MEPNSDATENLDSIISPQLRSSNEDINNSINGMKIS